MNEYSGLVTRAQSEDDHQRDDAFNELIRIFSGMAFHHAYATLGDQHLAEDATQDAFLTAYQRIGQLREPLAFPGWLKRIIYTQCDRILRRKQPIIESIDDRHDLASNEPDPETSLATLEMQNRLHEAIGALPESQRDVTEAYYIRGESQSEIANRLSIPVTTVKKRLQYARQQLKGVVGEWNMIVFMFFAGFIQQPMIQQPALVPVEDSVYAESAMIEQTDTTLANWDFYRD